jgi:hypothetical protein
MGAIDQDDTLQNYTMLIAQYDGYVLRTLVDLGEWKSGDLGRYLVVV